MNVFLAPDGKSVRGKTYAAAKRKTEACRRGRRVLQQPIADFFLHFGSSRTTEGVEQESEKVFSSVKYRRRTRAAAFSVP
ncbi:hypothetical protein ALC56_13713 [Trachymyrmex septentrionalis]|uniref:Uncharacterized protein n=1 Tax=Trachymyrmex septentrionalis TaxID=34720 RepID=A0A195EUM6_9HYME|nr:hypothetical protein ALC56_13713 [Trachymyrmex septentrionalis]